MALDQFGCQQKQVEASQSISKEIELEVTKKDEEKVDLNFSATPTLMSWTLETKISKVWVVFEDEITNESQILPTQQNLGSVNYASMSSKV
jgi:hypothetical protein